MVENEEKQQKLQEIYVELQVLQQQVQQYQQQLQEIEQQLMNVARVQQNLHEFKELEEGTEILVPLSAGIFAKAQIKDSKNLNVNVGSDVIVVKDVDSTNELLAEQVKELMNAQSEFANQLNELISTAQQKESELRSLME